MTSRLAASSLAVATVLALVGCAASGDVPDSAGARPYTAVTKATIRPGDPVPAPRGPAVLTLRRTEVTNVGSTLQFDLATLDRLGTVEYTANDRHGLGREVTFSGPLLRTLLDVAGVESGTLRCLGLNDYTVDLPASDAKRFPVLLATRADGEPMSVARYGPTRIVYPTRGYHWDASVYDPRWIWQLTSIQVR
jgi:hypothetical protein